jgi:hypothetical protein
MFDAAYLGRAPSGRFVTTAHTSQPQVDVRVPAHAATRVTIAQTATDHSRRPQDASRQQQQQAHPERNAQHLSSKQGAAHHADTQARPRSESPLSVGTATGDSRSATPTQPASSTPPRASRHSSQASVIPPRASLGTFAYDSRPAAATQPEPREQEEEELSVSDHVGHEHHDIRAAAQYDSPLSSAASDPPLNRTFTRDDGVHTQRISAQYPLRRVDSPESVSPVLPARQAAMQGRESSHAHPLPTQASAVSRINVGERPKVPQGNAGHHQVESPISSASHLSDRNPGAAARADDTISLSSQGSHEHHSAARPATSSTGLAGYQPK